MDSPTLDYDISLAEEARSVYLPGPSGPIHHPVDMNAELQYLELEM